MPISRQERKQRQEMRRQSLLRYQKQRQRNVLAQPGVHQFVLILDHLKAGFNVPKIFRSAEAFGAHAIHLIDIGPFDPAPSKGSFKKVPARFHEEFDSCYQQLSKEGYRFFTLEPGEENSLFEQDLPERSAFILGHEEQGICFDRELYPDIQTIAIPQYGSVESLNVSIAASVMMYEYVRQHLHRSESD